ncbi:Conserved hypothetical protein 2001 [hydrothermal vent metagenome]|uniref:Outer membrane protein beta-barrel domain-containing protein n=1 Tax=hydrothermal vent metagenome TaxID=652676 RepID=A0A3B0XN77_9ZZZZ
MKKLNVLLFNVVLAGAMLVVSSASTAGVKTNIGFASDYYFRGAFQAASSASAGIDYEHESGLYAGTWWADVDKGLETDFYGGYAGKVSEFDYDASLIVYDYTDGYDERYTEVNLKGGYKFISLEYAIGKYDTVVKQDYTFLKIKGEYKDFYALFGSWGNDLDGSYFELGYGTVVGGFDLDMAIIDNDKYLDSVTDKGNGETTMIFSLGKKFDL